MNRNKTMTKEDILDFFQNNHILDRKEAEDMIAELSKKHEMMLSLGKDAHLYCDMDGVVAVWSHDPIERTLEPGYFLALDLEIGVRNCLLLLTAAGFKVTILSSVYINGIADRDKTLWLEKYGMGSLDRIFVPYGQVKRDYIRPENNNEMQILLDDYNDNLLKWNRDGYKFVGVKFLNRANGNSREWTGRTAYCHSDGETLANTIADIAVMN